MTTPRERATSVIAALSAAYGVSAAIIPWDNAPADSLRAISAAWAPLISETADRRYWFVELSTLRTYASAISHALGEIEGVATLSDVDTYDTRDNEGTCLAFDVGANAPATDEKGWFVVRLTPNAALRALIQKQTHRDSLVDAQTTVNDVMAENLALESAAFANSRASYAADNDESATRN